MTNQHKQRKRTVTGIALAALLFSGMLVFNGVPAAQTAEEPQVAFRVRMLQAERAPTDKLAAGRRGGAPFSNFRLPYVRES